jgi:hypothetical protein
MTILKFILAASGWDTVLSVVRRGSLQSLQVKARMVLSASPDSFLNAFQTYTISNDMPRLTFNSIYHE